MRDINSYIFEKLVIDKDSTIYRYIVYYKNSSNERYKDHLVMKSLDELVELRKDTLKNKRRVFSCHKNYQVKMKATNT